MPEKMEKCPNCKNELSRDDWEYYDSEDDWYTRREEWSCECPHCKKIIWATLPYYLEENNIDFKVEGD